MVGCVLSQLKPSNSLDTFGLDPVASEPVGRGGRGLPTFFD